MNSIQFGSLADHFVGVGAKVLTQTEINKLSSNQHEFQGISNFRNILGESAEKVTFQAKFMWLEDNSENCLRVDSFCTWSDVRRNNPNRGAEYHLYYSAESEEVVHKAKAGDYLFIARTINDDLLVIISPPGEAICRQIEWLFGLSVEEYKSTFSVLEHEKQGVGLTAIQVLEELGIQLDVSEPKSLSLLLERFGKSFPSTKEFSAFSRQAQNLPKDMTVDDQLIAYMEHEEALFRGLEKVIVGDRLRLGFMKDNEADVDGFIQFSLSVQNRRKSRAGYALAHHVEAILISKDIEFTREATTEKKKAADFLFPNEAEYNNTKFPSSSLMMLAVKTSCKDRWRQVLAEANRITRKHLLTLQPAISETQTSEMEASGLQLVVPEQIRPSYKLEQQSKLLTFSDFLSEVIATAKN